MKVKKFKLSLKYNQELDWFLIIITCLWFYLALSLSLSLDSDYIRIDHHWIHMNHSYRNSQMAAIVLLNLLLIYHSKAQMKLMAVLRACVNLCNRRRHYLQRLSCQ